MRDALPITTVKQNTSARVETLRNWRSDLRGLAGDSRVTVKASPRIVQASIWQRVRKQGLSRPLWDRMYLFMSSTAMFTRYLQGTTQGRTVRPPGTSWMAPQGQAYHEPITRMVIRKDTAVEPGAAGGFMMATGHS